MYIFLKRLLREVFIGIILGKVDEVQEEELLDDSKIEQKYGMCTYILKLHDADSILAMSGILRTFILILGIGSVIGIIVLTFCLGIAPPEQRWVYILIPCTYIFLLICVKIHKDIYKYYKNIVTRDKIIIRRAFKKERIITYEEICKVAKKKKIVIRKGVFYIPTSRKPVRVEIFGNIYGELALEQIREKSKIAIPKITEKRKKHMSQASVCGLFNFFGLLMGAMSLCFAGSLSIGSEEGYFKVLFTAFPINLFVLISVGLFVIGKIYFFFGQLRLRNDINDSEHVEVRLF